MCGDFLPAHSENLVKNNTVSKIKIEKFDLFLKKYLESLIDGSTIHENKKTERKLWRSRIFKNKDWWKYENNKKSIDKAEKDILSLRNQVERHIEI